jgi:hypothetical protein
MNITEAMHQLRDLQARSPSLRPAFILALDEAAELNQAAEAGLDAIGIPSLLATDESGQPAVAMPELMRLLRTGCRFVRAKSPVQRPAGGRKENFYRLSRARTRQ